MDATCAGCHGGRVHGEYTGANETYAADVHYDDGEMTCMACHKAEEMHAAAGTSAGRHDLAQRPRCEQCHEEVVSATPRTRSHTIHRNKVAPLPPPALS